ncbi:MAG: aminotransferase class V-fold PLP-dependent enzyme [Steroidobacteraceae bacterium]
MPIYLDYAASTPIDPRVAQVMCECLGAGGEHGNPASLSHDFGRRARKLVERARTQIAQLLNAAPASIVLTSGATEANNLALFGAARFHATRGRHIISARTEHKAVLDPLQQLEREGFEVTLLKPEPTGLITAAQLEAALRPDTVLVSLMHANNETGAIQDVSAFGALCRARGILLHVDAAQSAGKLPIDVQAMNIDLLSLTGHKFYGPKGAGALYVRRQPALGLQPVLLGGGQEFGLRSGTVPTHQVVGLGLACELAAAEWAEDADRIASLRTQLWQGIASLGGIEPNGCGDSQLCSILNVCFHGVEGESLQFALRELAVSAGAACSSGSAGSSYVLRALGRSDQEAQSSLRFSLGRFTTQAEIDTAITVIRREIPRLRALAPRIAS